MCVLPSSTYMHNFNVNYQFFSWPALQKNSAVRRARIYREFLVNFACDKLTLMDAA